LTFYGSPSMLFPTPYMEEGSMRRVLTSLAVSTVALLATGPLAQAQQTTAHAAAKPTGKAAAKLDDPTIVAIFDATNTATIETNRLAETRAVSADVKALAHHFATDHQTVRQKGRDLAKKLDVTPTPPADRSSAKEHEQVMARLRAAPKAKFDCTFLEHEVAYHKAVLDAVSGTLMPAIQNAELKAFVEQVAPAFQGHMMAAENLAKKHGCEAPAK
jgi:putative membrane protein